MRQTGIHTILYSKQRGVNALIIKQYISEGGVPITVTDNALDDSPENRKRVYDNLGRMATNILIRKYLQEKKEQAKDWVENDEYRGVYADCKSELKIAGQE